MCGFTLAISCCVKISNIPSKFVKYIDVPLFKAVTVCNVIKKETLTQLFSCEFCEISKNTFSQRTPPVAASENERLSSYRR